MQAAAGKPAGQRLGEGGNAEPEGGEGFRGFDGRCGYAHGCHAFGMFMVCSIKLQAATDVKARPRRSAVLILAKQSQWSAPSSLPRKRESIVPQTLALI